MITALVITASNRAAAGTYDDTSGRSLAELLRGVPDCEVYGPRVVPDGEPIEAALRDAVAAGYDAVITTGGTGLTPMDLTPEMTRRVIDYEIPGIPEAIRQVGLGMGLRVTPLYTAVLTRGLAGVAGRTLIVNLPGSKGGVKDGMAVLAPLLHHAIDQIHGGDHPRS